MRTWPYRRINRRCPYAQEAGEVAAEWARRGKEFTAPELYQEVFERLNLRKVYLRKAAVEIRVNGKVVKSWGGRTSDPTELLRAYVIGRCDAELRDRFGDGTPHFIDKEIGGRRTFLYSGVVNDPKRVEAEAMLYGGQEFDLRVQREWRQLLADAMRILNVSAEEAKDAINTPEQVRANLLAGRPPGA